ncbi:uncharacterized protein LOC117179973 isoform X2 [Belonocnema kinseyi]|uniref:uncharacterized protein LOC117179973 isoform X2 n=1 Tax=Belonocnema kinseyi TaxID=2817044 RepID=UPI00143D5B74|nr:uncharacterized protein LOC117179973 isoform X2 [Belonocnema kinseyi]
MSDKCEKVNAKITVELETISCYICNGYYGPCFEEPVCATCHAFLFPDDVGLLQIPTFSEKTDDEDSGNDEPTDLCYNIERRSSQQQHNVPQISSNSLRNLQFMLDQSSPQRSFLELQKLVIQKNNHSFQEDSSTAFSIQDVTSMRSYLNNYATNASSQNIFKHSERIVKKTPARPHDQNFQNDRLFEEDIRGTENLFSSIEVKDFENDVHWPWNFHISPEMGELSRPRSLSERLEMLTNHKHMEHEPINEPGLVERLPPEVLLTVFYYLDDLSLWSAVNVCRRWYGLLSTHVTSQHWQQNVRLRWPLYKSVSYVPDWYKIYDQLASSSPCRTCLVQTSLQTKLPRMEENSWRRNRLRSELKGLRIDPPEGIEAVPLDQMCYHWQATITGPAGSPYEGGLFFLYLQVPYSYPMRPPAVRFLTRILHPNVSRHGDVGIDSIHHNWSLALTISKVLISVQSLLTDPYCQICMEPELGDMYINDREKFEDIARLWTWKYAMHDVITRL